LPFFPSLLLPLSFFPLKNQTSIALLPPPLFLLQDVVMQVATSPRGGMSIKKGQGSEKKLTFFCFVFPFFYFYFVAQKSK
jgi:hypothetical protein